MIGDKELQRIRADAEKLLPDTCHILSATRTPDGQGGYTETWGTAVASVKCRVDANQSGGREQIGDDALRSYKQFVITLPYNTNISADNVIRVGGQDYAVIAVDRGTSWAAVIHAIAERK